MIYVEYACGCYYEHGYAPGTNTLEHIRLSACTECWDRGLEMLTQLTLDKQSQLTIPLA